MKPITLFTFGYCGWGNHTPQLVKAVDAVERSRGLEPPLFVDIRIRRAVRAKGFQGNAFEKLLGEDRHRWMKSLGNKFIVSRTGPHIQIAEPAAADELLDLAIESADHKQRLLFFCSCQWPRKDGHVHCHRVSVAKLALKAAEKRGVGVEIVEWPGGEPTQIDLDVTPQVFAAVRRGRTTVPLGKRPDFARVAGLPWCSLLTLRSKGDELYRVVGPAICQTTGWALPLLPVSHDEEDEDKELPYFSDPKAGKTKYEQAAEKLRRHRGLEPLSI